MKTKTIPIMILLLFVGVSVGFVAYKNVIPSAPEKNQAIVEVDKKVPDRVVAYYFYSTNRCPTCMRIESLSEAAIRGGFKEPIQKGTLEWLAVNTDEPENSHFLTDFQLYTKSLVLVKIAGGKQSEWKNLDKVWELVQNEGEFIQYVQKEVTEFMGKS